MAKQSNGGVEADQLRAFVERIERLEEEKKSIAEDIKSIYAEAEANGYDTKALREVVKLRGKGAMEKRNEFQTILEVYLHALGMLADLPLGKAAIEHFVTAEVARS
jgi:uncharacterized protein (UPF0335 family)